MPEPVALRADLDAHAWGPRGLPAMQAASSAPSPVPVIVAGMDALAVMPDRTEAETALLRRCCEAVIAGQWFGRAGDAVTILQSLPVPAAPLPLALSPHPAELPPAGS